MGVSVGVYELRKKEMKMLEHGCVACDFSRLFTITMTIHRPSMGSPRVQFYHHLDQF